MEISQLKAFRVVAEKLSFTKASEELNLTQSAVSYQIRKLEESLGEKLFVRHRKGILLTPQGELVLAYADRLFEQIETLQREITEHRESLAGEIKIVSQTRSLNTPFARIRKDFRKVYEGIDLSFYSAADSVDIIELVRRGDFDLAITIAREDAGFISADLEFIPYGEFEMSCVVGRDHPLASAGEVSIKELQEQEWILFGRDNWIRKVTEKCFAKYGLRPSKIHETNDAVTVLSMIESNQGIGLLPNWSIYDHLESGRLLSVKPMDVNTDISINLVRSARKRVKAVDIFIDYLLGRTIKGVRRFPVNH